MKAQLLFLTLAIASCTAVDLVCPEQFDPENPTFLPHEDCTKYYVCNWQTPVERNCPAGLHWNAVANYCDYPSQAGCVAGGSPPVSSTTTTTTTTAAPVQPAEECPQEYNPDQTNYLPHEDCTKYYICSWGGQAIEQDCPAGLHWSQVNRYCDFPEQAGCSAVKPSSPSTPASTAAPAVSSTTPAAGECPEVYDPSHQVYFPHVDCSKYYICTYEGTKLEQNCPPTLHWSAANQYCDHPDRAQCKSSTATSTEVTSPVPTTTTEVPTESTTPEVTTTHRPVTTTTPAPAQCPPENDQDLPVFLPHESDCTKYYVCEHGRPTQLNCPPGTFWNAAENVCDLPEHSGCVQRMLLRNL